MNGKKTYQVVRAGIARTFQNIRLFDQMTVEENVLVAFNESFTYRLGGAIFRTPTFWKQERDMHAKAIDLLRIFGLEDWPKPKPRICRMERNVSWKSHERWRPA